MLIANCQADYSLQIAGEWLKIEGISQMCNLIDGVFPNYLGKAYLHSNLDITNLDIVNFAI